MVSALNKFIEDPKSVTDKELLEVIELSEKRGYTETKNKAVFLMNKRKNNAEYDKKYNELWNNAAIEYKKITDYWLMYGATHRVIGDKLTIWSVDGTEFYRWWSGVMILDEITRTRMADKKFKSIIKERG